MSFSVCVGRACGPAWTAACRPPHPFPPPDKDNHTARQGQPEFPLKTDLLKHLLVAFSTIPQNHGRMQAV